MAEELDINALLTPIPGDDPTGPELEYDPEFAALNLAAAGKPEQVMGDKTIAAVPPDWPVVQEQAEALLGRTKDLRVAVHLTHASTRIGGLLGLEAGLRLIRHCLEMWWDTIHPRLDPEDDNDPTLRVNTLLPLASPQTILGAILVSPIVRSRTLGKFSYRDQLVAAGDLTPLPTDQGRVIDSSQIDGAFQDADLNDLKATAAAIESALASVAGIEAAIANQIGAPNGPDLDRLTDMLNGINVVVTNQLALRGVGEAVAGDAPGGAKGMPGGISSRDDAMRAMDRICDYFERNEPSSPVPLLLRRAQKLARMDFLDIIRDMTPAGITEAETIGGIRKPE